MMHEIVLNGYTAHNSNNRCLHFGTAESYGIEKIHIIAGPGWEDMLIKAVFHPPSGDSVVVLLGEDGIIDVPPEATAVSAGEYNPGVIVFSGVADGVQRISANLAYTVIGHAPVEGKESEPTPSQWEQLAAQYQSKVDKQQGAENAGKFLAVGENGEVALSEGVKPEQIAAAVDAYLDENPIEAGATQEEAAQIRQNKTDIETLQKDKLSASELDSAIDSALAQAKESGEFDGKDGDPFTYEDFTEEQLAALKGKDGDNYVLTESDKTEIAEQAAQLVEVPEVEIPTALPNPNALTFTGAVSGTYDGSASLTVEIPQGGGDAEIPDEQIENAVNAWLDEHPEATTTVADGSITPQKLSFYKAQKEMTSLGDLDFSESVNGQTIGLWYWGYLSESIEVDGNFSIISYTSAPTTGTFASIAPVYYDANGEFLMAGAEPGTRLLSVSAFKSGENPCSIVTYLPPEGAATLKWYAKNDATDASHWSVLDFASLPKLKPWVSEEIADMFGQNNAVVGDILPNYQNSRDRSFRIEKGLDTTKIDFLPDSVAEIQGGAGGTVRTFARVYLDPIELNGHTTFYLSAKSDLGNGTRWDLYGEHGLIAYDENWNPLVARTLQYTPESTDYITAERLGVWYEGAYGTRYYRVNVDPAVKYLLPTDSAWMEFKYSFEPFNPLFSSKEIATFEAPLSVQNYIKDALRPDYYSFRQIGRLVPNGDCNYVAWNHNTLHYDATRNQYVMTMRGSNLHGGSVSGAKFVTIDPVTLESMTRDIVVGGVTVDWVNGFTIDDAGKYMMVCRVNDVQHYATSEDGGASWTDGGAVVIDTSSATNANTAKYDYTKFFNLHRLSTGTLLASYDDTVSPTNQAYQFVARSTDGVNWTLIEFAGENCEMSFYEHDGTIMMIGRRNSYRYKVEDYAKNESYNNAGIAYSYDDGQSWTGSAYSVSVRANVQNVSIREHDGIVELMAMNRDFNKYPRGYIYHYTATPEEALADRFTLREVFQCNAYGAGDVTGGALAFDRYGHGLFAYSDNHGVNSNYDYLHFLYGAKANTPSVCADSVASEFLPYSGKKTQELIDALNAKIEALGK